MSMSCNSIFVHRMRRAAFLLAVALVGAASSPAQTTFNVRDYFRLTPGDSWHLIGLTDEGSGPEADFTYAVQSDRVNVGGTRLATPIQTIFDADEGPRHLDRDLFYFVPGTRPANEAATKGQTSAGALLYYGIQFGTPLNLGGLTISEVILDDPVFLGGDGEVTGGNNGMDTGTATLPLVGSATVNSNVSYLGIETVTVPLGTFRDVLHIRLDITITVPFFGTFEFLQNELWFARGVGLIRQRQVVAPEITLAQGLESGTVGGAVIVPPACGFALDPAGAAFGRQGGIGEFGVAANFPDCEWSPVASADWIVIDGFGGLGNGPVSYQIAPNTTGMARGGAITVGTQVHDISQDGLPGIGLILDHLLGKTVIPPEQQAAADVNQDGALDIADAIAIINQTPAP